MIALEAILMHLNWGQIFSVANEKCRHVVVTLKHPKLFIDKVNWAILTENGVLLVSKKTQALFPGVATSSRGLFQEESNLLKMHTSEGFNPNACKLIE